MILQEITDYNKFFLSLECNQHDFREKAYTSIITRRKKIHPGMYFTQSRKVLLS